MHRSYPRRAQRNGGMELVGSMHWDINISPWFHRLRYKHTSMVPCTEIQTYLHGSIKSHHVQNSPCSARPDLSNIAQSTWPIMSQPVQYWTFHLFHGVLICSVLHIPPVPQCSNLSNTANSNCSITWNLSDIAYPPVLNPIKYCKFQLFYNIPHRPILHIPTVPLHRPNLSNNASSFCSIPTCPMLHIPTAPKLQNLVNILNSTSSTMSEPVLCCKCHLFYNAWTCPVLQIPSLPCSSLSNIAHSPCCVMPKPVQYSTFPLFNHA